MEQAANPRFERLVKAIRRMNDDIEADHSLGRGFRIGHGYFGDKPELIDDVFLRDVVEYELIPLIEEYWFDQESKVAAWSEGMRGAVRG